ncbi:signal transduction histidine kinase [Delftia acidovorans]|uniref:sensor histidine kinase n=1 Tax=Delftia acidovorans TaxID=80866 RepID=UPI000F4B10D2|nr:ATP-binding protein [Delftia acidovorans]ROQ93078.1 signal transduction histidine kinase [Delftia acidovorans]
MNEDDLKAELELCRAEIRSLREELDETNRGVVALYGELDVQAEKLRKATELKSHFLSYMSHEFRTPIGAIRSNARLLLDHVDGPLTTEQTRQVGFIQETAAEFSEMVNDLLDLAKIEAGRLEISPGWFKMMDLFAALRGMFKAMADNVELSLVFEEPGDLPRFYTDNRKLSQILRNFISNALKFTPQGEIKVSAELVGDMLVKFSVADTGIGIASEFHDAIFNDFTQVDSPIQKRLRGTGLGLALSKQLAQLLGGWVEVQSALGEGSTFSVIVPAHLPVDTKDLKA